MLRGHRIVLGVLAALALPALESGAQYSYPYGNGYGGYGFGGFDGSVNGDIARGMGAFAAGAGTYNYNTAVVNSVNSDTVMRYNNYIYQSQLEANAREHALLARRQGRENASTATAQQIAQRLRDNPGSADIDSGAALNAILDQLSAPGILSGSTLRLANAKVEARLIKDIPFRDATDAITITLSQLTDDKSWPDALRDPKLDAERQAYSKAVADALEEDKNGDLSAATVAKVRQAVADLYRRVGETIPVTRQPDHLQAMNYLKGLAGFSRMLERPNVDKVIAELEKIETTSVGNLIAFMHSYNLRFGAATTAPQKAAYAQLYPIMAGTREKLLGKPGEGTNNANAPATPAAPAAGAVTPASPTELFHGIDPQHLHPGQIPARPTPGPEATPNTPAPPK